jgi:YHS domain-containing protein
MPGTRAERKSSLVAVLTQLGLGIALGLAASQPERAAAADRIVIDWHTGLALYGFDPVAYFTDATANVGKADFEYTYGGAVWRFRNPGNRAAFIDHPEVYMPMFGGYDPIGVARGLPTPGHPLVWLIVGQHLFLFHDTGSRAAFATDPAQSIADAQAQWSTVMKGLAP